MRRLTMTLLGGALLQAIALLVPMIALDTADAATRRPRRAAAAILDAPVTIFECDAPRGVDAFGSTERCLRTLCVGRNVVNEYVLDDTRRQRRNPCTGIDPFERRR